AALAAEPATRLRPGPVGGHDRRARQHAAVRRAPARQGDPARTRPVGPRRPARLAVMARADRAPSAPLLLTEGPEGLDDRHDPPDRPPPRHRGGLARRLRDADPA